LPTLGLVNLRSASLFDTELGAVQQLLVGVVERKLSWIRFSDSVSTPTGEARSARAPDGGFA
jgi:hypothetical protein